MTIHYTMYHCRLLLVLLLSVNILKSHAAIEPLCKDDQSAQAVYDTYLKKLTMGYKEHKPKPHEDMKDIRFKIECGVKKICLTFLHFGELLLKQYGRQKATEIKSLVINQVPNIKQLFAILYNINIDGKTLYPMWLFLLYSYDFDTYWKFYTRTTKSPVESMIATNRMITGQLKESTAGCQNQNIFDVTDQNCPFYLEFENLKEGSPTFETVTDLHRRYYTMTWEYLKGIDTKLKTYEKIDPNNLTFYYDLLKNQKILSFPDLYGRNIQWGGMSEALTKACRDARSPENLYCGLVYIKQFQSIYLARIKMIMLRLLASYMLLVAKEEKTQTIADANEIMHETVNSFAQVTGFNDNMTFTTISSYLRSDTVKVTEQMPESQSVVDAIKKELTASCLSFKDCDATINLGGDVLQIYEEVIKFVKRFPQRSTASISYVDEANTPLIEDNNLHKSIKCAVLFLRHVQCLLGNADVDLHKSIFASAVVISKNF